MRFFMVTPRRVREENKALNYIQGHHGCTPEAAATLIGQLRASLLESSQ